MTPAIIDIINILFFLNLLMVESPKNSEDISGLSDITIYLEINPF